MSSKSWWNTQFNYVISRFFFEISLFSILNLFKFYLRISCYKSNGGMMPRCNWFLLSKFYHVFVYNSTIFKLVEFFFYFFDSESICRHKGKAKKYIQHEKLGLKVSVFWAEDGTFIYPWCLDIYLSGGGSTDDWNRSMWNYPKCSFCLLFHPPTNPETIP